MLLIWERGMSIGDNSNEDLEKTNKQKIEQNHA